MKLGTTSTKALIGTAALLVTAIAVVGWLTAHRGNLARRPALTPSGGSEVATTVARKTTADPDAARIPALVIRRRMSDVERLQLLEKNGEVFKDADIKEYQLAQKTTWWGKPLDPVIFWKGRVLWLDSGARTTAHRHGREWPPMPYKDPRLPEYPKDDGIDWSWATPDGPNLHYGMSSEEGAFWTRFESVHPRPPDDLEAHQYKVATRVLEERGRTQHEKADQSALQRASGPIDFYRKQALEMGYPNEAYSEDALFWAFVLSQRKQYQELVQRGHAPESALVKRIVDDVPVEANYITEPLTEDQMRAANAWKIRYLQRLRKESTNESYVNAYLQAWNLSAAEVFGGTNGQ